MDRCSLHGHWLWIGPSISLWYVQIILTYINAHYSTWKHFVLFCKVHLGIEFYLFVSHGGMKDRESTCKFLNAWSAFRNLHVDPLSFITQWETSRIQSLYLYFFSKLSCFSYEISVLNTQRGGIQNSRRSSWLIRHGNGTMEKWMSKFFLCS